MKGATEKSPHYPRMLLEQSFLLWREEKISELTHKVMNAPKHSALI
jgi:hypothetical protein